jgi:hypothetical protein
MHRGPAEGPDPAVAYQAGNAVGEWGQLRSAQHERPDGAETVQLLWNRGDRACPEHGALRWTVGDE